MATNMPAVKMPIPRFLISRWRYTFTALVLTIILMKEVTSQLSNTSTSPCTDANGGCNQFCTTINEANRRCECGIGLFLDPNGTSCVTKPLQKNRFLLMTDQGLNNTFQIDVDTGEVRALTLDKDMSPTAMTYDPACNCLYWFDSTNERIMKTVIGNSYSEILINVSGSDITSLAIDTDSRTLFYTDRVSSTIMRLSLLTLNLDVFMSEAGSKPRTLCLDTYSRLIYWSDCGNIQQSSVTNSSVNRAPTARGLPFCVTVLALDPLKRELLGGDESGNIGVTFLGTSSTNALLVGDHTALYTGMAFDDRFIYLADAKKRQILRLDRATNQFTNFTRHIFGKPYALIYYSIRGDSQLTKSILASVISGAFVLIAIVTIVVLVARRKRNRAQGTRSTPPDNRHGSSVYEEIADDDGTYTEPVGGSHETGDSSYKRQSYTALLHVYYNNVKCTEPEACIGEGGDPLYNQQSNATGIPESHDYLDLKPDPDESQQIPDAQASANEAIQDSSKE